MITKAQALELVAQSKDWRKRMDALLKEMMTQQETEHLDPHQQMFSTAQTPESRLAQKQVGRQLSLSITYLEEAQMRLGQRLRWISEACPEAQLADPYPTSKDPSSPVVHPRADTAS
jgi:hypothetical protein